MIILRLTQCLETFDFLKFQANDNVISEQEYNTIFDDMSSKNTYGLSYTSLTGNLIHLTTI